MATVKSIDFKNSIGMSDERNFCFSNLVGQSALAREHTSHVKERAGELTRQVPLQLLALEWFNKIDASIETRAYLVENFLPILVLGCEKVLKEAQRRHLVEANKADHDFNPVNQLAQYMMRNNPKYNNQNETSPYVRTMREIYQQLRDQMFAYQENKLARVKADVRKRRSEREKQEKLKQAEVERRRTELEGSFNKWLLSPTGRIEISIIQIVLGFYDEHVSNLPEDMQKLATVDANKWPSYCYKREGLELDKRILKKEYAECILKMTEHLSSDIFDFFVEYVDKCANYLVYRANVARFKSILRALFQIIDATKAGFLNRRRLVELLQTFRQKRATQELRDPFDWPVLDVLLKYENEPLELKPPVDPEPIVVKVDATEPRPPVAPVEAKPPVPEKKPSAEQESATQVKNSIDSSATEAEIKFKDDEADRTDDEGVSRKESINLKLSLIKKPDSNRPRPLSPASFEIELLFLKGGKFYYSPLGDNLKAFDSQLLAQKDLMGKSEPFEAIKADSTVELDKFDSNLLNESQFVNMVNNFIQPSFLKSEIFVNDLVKFIKDNYYESQQERNAKLQKVQTEDKNSARREKFDECFERLDNEGSQSLSLDQLSQALESFKDGMYKEKVRIATEGVRVEIMASQGKSADRLSKDEFIEYLFSLSDLVDFAKFDDQVCQYLRNTVSVDYMLKTRGEARKAWLKQIEKIGNITYGSFEPLYKQLFFTLLKDAENYGNNKNISAYVAILEKISQSVVGLRYHATTPKDSSVLLGNVLTRKMKNITFGVIDSGSLLHVSRVRANSSIHFFAQDSKRDGSLVLLPLNYARNKTFGTIGIDTMHDSRQAIFVAHELEFYQGVATVFAKAYANIIFRNRLIKACISAADWLNKRTNTVESVNVYFVQLMNQETQIDLKTANQATDSEQTMASARAAPAEESIEKLKLNLKPIMKLVLDKEAEQPEDLLKYDKKRNDKNYDDTRISKHIYECAVNSENTVSAFNNKTSYCVPIRNEDHQTTLVFELISKMDTAETRVNIDEDLDEIETVLYVLQKCQEELLEEHFLGVSDQSYAFENEFEEDKYDILFEKVFVRYIVKELEGKTSEKLFHESNEDVQSIVSLIADLLSYFSDEHIIDEKFVGLLKSFDATTASFNFKRNPGKFNLAKEETYKNLHKLNRSLERTNVPLRLIIDWLCLVRNMKAKADRIRQSFSA